MTTNVIFPRELAMIFARGNQTLRLARAGLIGLTFVVPALQFSTAATVNWPQWRGPKRDGSVAALELPAQWAKSPKLLWQMKIGEGVSSPFALWEKGRKCQITVLNQTACSSSQCTANQISQ
jgi:hypothetical protein